MMGEQQNQVENLDIDPKACGHVIWDKPASQCMVGGGGILFQKWWWATV